MTDSTAPESQVRITHALVTLTQFGLAAAFSAYLATESPEPLSLEDWSGILVPPLAFLLAWWLGRTVQTDSGSRSWSYVSRAGNIITKIGLALTVLMVPVLVIGSFMDKGIG